MAELPQVMRSIAQKKWKEKFLTTHKAPKIKGFSQMWILWIMWINRSNNLSDFVKRSISSRNQYGLPTIIYVNQKSTIFFCPKAKKYCG